MNFELKAIARREWPLLLALGLLLCAVAGVLVASLRLNDGRFVYALDDPYIHMAMAKHIVADGVWGVTRHSFASASSSPLWLLLLSGTYGAAGVHDVVPLLLNLASAIALLILSDRIIMRYTSRPSSRLLLALALITFVPFVPIIFCGLEHLLHALMAVAFTWSAARVLSDPKQMRRGDIIMLFVLAPLLTSIRYEGAMMVGVVAALFFARKRFAPAVALLLLGALPVVAYGLFTMANGWLFFPNPIVLKGNLPYPLSVGGVIRFIQEGSYGQIIHNPHIALFLIVCGIVLWLAIGRRGFRSIPSLFLTIVLATTLLHIQFGGVGWFHRYEAYLMAAGVIGVAISLAELYPSLALRSHIRTARAIPALIALFILLLPFIHRGLKILVTPRATANIHQQQYQMGLFLREYYAGVPVAVNDIGAVCYLGDSPIVDIYGLGSLEVAKLRRAGRMSTEEIERLAREGGARIAIVYDSWLMRDGGIPASWRKVGEWNIEHNVVCGSETVSFYGIDSAETERLVRSFSMYRVRLPREVTVREYRGAKKRSVHR